MEGYSMLSNLVFPQSPPIVAEWQPVFLEPIIGSGERIAILIIIKEADGNISINRTVSESILKSLYATKYSQLNGLISYLEKVIKKSPDWKIPFEGVNLGPWSKAADFSVDGILRQALSQTSSLCTHVNEPEGSSGSVSRASSYWLNSVKDLVIKKNPKLLGNFDCKIIIAKNVSYSYSFNYKSFAANLLDFKSLNNQKAQTSIFQMQLLSKNTLIKEKELILQMPSQIELSTMTEQKRDNIYEKINLFSDLLLSNEVKLSKVETAEQASEKLLAIAV